MAIALRYPAWCTAGGPFNKFQHDCTMLLKLRMVVQLVLLALLAVPICCDSEEHPTKRISQSSCLWSRRRTGR